MAGKHFVKICIFTFALLMVMLRPFFAYHILLTGQFPKEPAKVSQLLSGLVKKKNESHSNEADESAEIAEVKRILLPAALFILLITRTNRFLSILSRQSLALGRRTIFHVSPSNQYYQFICRFQI